MKIINYNRGYNDIFECSIHGTIKMNREEFDQAVKYLFMDSDRIRKDHEYFNSKLLERDLARRIHIKNKRGISQGFFVNIRVSATEALVKHFNLKGYKRGNYQLQIDTSVQNSDNFNYLISQL